ncbi:hypothetical protein DVH05_006173 [Phytophthora capsici]|nr:hypothetical protein DVH05_006173 [Phytophthora capsici]
MGRTLTESSEAPRQQQRHKEGMPRGVRVDRVVTSPTTPASLAGAAREREGGLGEGWWGPLPPNRTALAMTVAAAVARAASREVSSRTRTSDGGACKLTKAALAAEPIVESDSKFAETGEA